MGGKTIRREVKEKFDQHIAECAASKIRFEVIG